MSRWALQMSVPLHRMARRWNPTLAAVETPATPAAPQGGVLVGELSDASGGNHHVPLSQFLVSSHCVGATGSGKTLWAVELISQLLDRGIPTIILDAKGDLFEICLDLLTHRLVASNDDTSLSRIRTIDLFSSRYVVPFNLCARDDSVPVDVQAYELADLMLRTIDHAETGIRQGRLLHHLLALLISAGGLSILDAPKALANSTFLAGLVSRTPERRVRDYFANEFAKEPNVTKSGIMARLDALTRLPSWRAMFGCKDALDFRGLFNDGITLVTTGNSPLGCRDLQTFAGRLIFLRLARAIMSRPVMASIKPAVVVIDEVQEVLSDQVASELERLLALARSRKVSLSLFHQQVAQLEKVSALLPRILKTNCGLQAVFRTSLEDARHFGHVLPVTGQVLRSDYRPDERSSHNPYLTASEEKTKLLESIPDLPSRSFYLWQSGGGAAKLLRSPDVPFALWRRTAQANSELREQVYRGSVALPVSEENESDLGSESAPPVETDPVRPLRDYPQKVLSPDYGELG